MIEKMRELIPFFFWAVVCVLVTWGAWTIVTSREKIPETNGNNGNPRVDTIPPAVVDQPMFEEVTADGAVRWTLYLDRIVREEGGVMELESPRAVYRMESGEELEVRGESGIYDEENGVLRLTGNVTGTAETADFTFTVEEMAWNSTDGLIDAWGGVEVTREGISFTGSELKMILAEEFSKLVVSGGVEVTTAQSALEELEEAEL